MVQGKKQLNCKPKFVEVVIGDNVLKYSLIFRAFNYLIRIYDELTNYLYIPEMPIDNTDTERLIRDMVIGKKPYLFCRDLKRAAKMYSLSGACKKLDKNPKRWLCHVLKNSDSMPKDKLYTLLPEFWEDEEQQTASTGISWWRAKTHMRIGNMR